MHGGYVRLPTLLCIEVTETFSLFPVYIYPRAGPQQGGTAVIVTGPCFEESYNIICAFGGREVEGIYISEQQALCISPQLPSFGRLTFKLTLTSTTGFIVFEGETIFFSSK